MRRRAGVGIGAGQNFSGASQAVIGDHWMTDAVLADVEEPLDAEVRRELARVWAALSVPDRRGRHSVVHHDGDFVGIVDADWRIHIMANCISTRTVMSTSTTTVSPAETVLRPAFRAKFFRSRSCPCCVLRSPVFLRRSLPIRQAERLKNSAGLARQMVGGFGRLPTFTQRLQCARMAGANKWRYAWRPHSPTPAAARWIR